MQTRDEFGVWSVTIPDVNGKSGIPHKSRVKVQLTKGYSGERTDRVPAYIKWAKAEEGVMGAKYDGYYWDPPKSDQARRAERSGGHLPTSRPVCPASVAGSAVGAPASGDAQEFSAPAR